jgi:hypothetical protein
MKSNEKIFEITLNRVELSFCIDIDKTMLKVAKMKKPNFLCRKTKSRIILNL